MASEKTFPDEYTQLQNMILGGEILPNERIVEADYAAKLNSNRTNIRRALARLEQDGLIVSEPFRGARVRLVTPDEAIEIFELRLVLETLIVERCAQKIVSEQADVLYSILARLNDEVRRENPMMVGVIARRLREEIWRIAGHNTAARTMTNLNSQLVRIWYQSVMMPGRVNRIAEDLTEVVAALRAQDAQRAVDAMRRHHEGAIASLKGAILQNARMRATNTDPLRLSTTVV